MEILRGKADQWQLLMVVAKRLVLMAMLANCSSGLLAGSNGDQLDQVSDSNSLHTMADESRDDLFLPKRLLYDVANSGQQCEKCHLFGKTTCWGRVPNVQGGHGNWDLSYCCGPSDTKCAGYTYCSNTVTNKILMDFTCPIDKNSCPWGSDKEFKLQFTNDK